MQFRILMILAIATMSGCNDAGLEPFETTLAGRFILETVKGAALPAVTGENDHERWSVLADTIDFAEPRLARKAVAYRIADKTTGQTRTMAVEYAQPYRILSYDRRGAVIEFLCDDAAMCIGPFLGRISLGGTMTTGIRDAQTYRYRRIQ
jgi:hypothetical protein